MEKIDKIFYINLEKKTDRKEHFIEQTKIHNIPTNKIIRFNAINGDTYNFNEIELNMFKNTSYRTNVLTPYKIQKKIMGNQLSHYYILLEMKKNNYENILICQDDVIFKHGIVKYMDKMMENIPENTEIINIGMHNLANFDKFIPYDLNNNELDISIIKNKITDYISEYNVWNTKTNYRVNPASLAYIVTKKGCINLLEYFNKNGFLLETDWNYNFYLQSKNIFFGSTFVLATGNNNFTSDIFINNISIDELIDTNLYFVDKNIFHSYFRIYDKLFLRIRETAKRVLEIGIGNFFEKNGGNLLLWSLYFKNSQIYGADSIKKENLYDIVKKEPRITTFTDIDPYSNYFIDSLKKYNLKFDVIIDDGPHTFESQCKFIQLYIELLSENGILIVEDIPDISRINKFIELTPPHLRQYIKIYDLRKIKSRYDDILFVITLNKT